MISSEVNLPFSRGAIVVGEPMRVPAAADAQTLEQARGALERALNAGTERAHAIVDRRNLSLADEPRLRNKRSPQPWPRQSSTKRINSTS